MSFVGTGLTFNAGIGPIETAATNAAALTFDQFKETVYKIRELLNTINPTANLTAEQIDRLKKADSKLFDGYYKASGGAKGANSLNWMGDMVPKSVISGGAQAGAIKGISKVNM